MHILVTNDDGPPSTQSSPYILPFVHALESKGHTVSVIIPHTQRSWIGKAHIVGQDVQATHYFPPSQNPDTHLANSGSTPPSGSGSEDDAHPWVLVNSTPASCAQLASEFFSSRGTIDLVISGPNYGRNTSALFALSSGTLGAALEATQCGYHSIALSFAFFDRVNDPAVVSEACKQGVRVCEFLAKEGKWENAQLYSVNVPVVKEVCQRAVRWTRVLQNSWAKGACFTELPAGSGVDDADTEEQRLRRQESGAQGQGGVETPNGKWKHRHFKWAPRFSDVYESVQKGGPGTDGWVIKEGETSVTALRANFMHAEGPEGELKL